MSKKSTLIKPKYNLSEELINSISHGVGAALSVVGLVLTIVFAAKHNNVLGIVSSCIYGVSMIVMYTISCLYHALSPRLRAKKVFRVLDHCDIYVYIAGCYTPFCLSLIGGTFGWILFAIVWLCATIGVLLNAIDLEKYKKPSLALYLIMGWMILISTKSLLEAIEPAGLYLLLCGGVIYTIGAVLYAIGSKKRYYHSVFHFFVLGGSILQFFSILLFAL